MPCLSVFAAANPQHPDKVLGWPEHVSITLAEVGVRYVQCVAAQPLNMTSSDEAVLQAYAAPVAQLLALDAGLSVQLVRIRHGQPLANAPHGHCLDEHSHSEDERHLFVAGQALLSLHVGDRVYQLLCERGDLLVIPAGIRHWLDLGAQDNCMMIRLRGSAEGERVELSGEPIAAAFARLED
jgi:1,2-dihydroxy-3-keto-5-methylthiopentene dioxygenase